MKRLGITGFGCGVGLDAAARLVYEGSFTSIRALDVTDPEILRQRFQDMLVTSYPTLTTPQVNTILEKLDVFKGDIRNKQDVSKLIEECQVVMHLAFLVMPCDRPYDRVWMDDVNINGSRTVFDAVKESSSVEKLIYLSSVAAYGYVREEHKNKVIDEEFPTCGAKVSWHYYFYAKGVVESVVQQLQNQRPDLKVTIIRPHLIGGGAYFDRMIDVDPAIKTSNPLLVLQPINHDRPLIQLVDAQDVVDVLCIAASKIDSLVGNFNLAGTFFDKEEFFSSKGLKIIRILPNSILFNLIRTVVRFAGLFSVTWKLRGIWMESLLYQPIVDSSKVEKVLDRKLISTQQILEDLWMYLNTKNNHSRK